ncbi:ferritin-like domain-containing protein [Helicobacter burdigaliensis]|uniref:ferritin-like domain-containing protein n=1 Tax=Helicobacter burdigaliensis TaxID=2315334 RepID=UPI000EF707EC|nr:hypothetical protein [Helicobacter burdigaliensis]
MTQDNLLLAIFDEYKAYSFYAMASSVYGEPFSNLLIAESNHINALSVHCQYLGIEIPQNPYEGTTSLPNTLEEVLLVALENENANLLLYDKLIANEENPMLKDTFYRLQAASFNHHIPALQNALESLNQTNGERNFLGSLQQGKELLEEANLMVANLQSGNLTQGELEGFLNKLNYSLVGGVIAGAFSALILNEILNQNKE